MRSPGPVRLWRRGLREAVAVADFNNDGRDDIAVANYFDANVTVLLGKANGGFSPASGSPVAARAGASALAAGDFDNDGNQDMAVTATDDGSLVIRLGDGTGGFETPFVTFALPGVGDQPYSVATADFNGDGNTDLAMASNGGGVTVRLGDGSGGFSTSAPGSPYTTSTGGSGVATGDFNEDGIDDLVEATDPSNGADPGLLYVLLGSGGGGLAAGPGSPFPTLHGARRVALGDFNRDGHLDVAVAAIGGGGAPSGLQVRLGDGQGRFSTQAPAIDGGVASPWYVAVGEFKTDGNEDLISANTDSDGAAVSTFLGKGNVGATFRRGPGSPFTLGGDGRGVALGDFNNDGREDFVMVGGAHGIYVKLGGGKPADPGNLLRNGGGEGANAARLSAQHPGISMWRTAGAFTHVRYGAPGGFPGGFDANRIAGQHAFFSGGPAASDSSARQKVKVRPRKGTRARLSAYLGGYRTDGDAMSVKADFLNRKGNRIGGLTIGPVTPADRHQLTTLLPRSAAGKLPKATRRIVVTLSADYFAGGYNDAYADRVSLTVKAKKNKKK